MSRYNQVCICNREIHGDITKAAAVFGLIAVDRLANKSHGRGRLALAKNLPGEEMIHTTCLTYKFCQFFKYIWKTMLIGVKI